MTDCESQLADILEVQEARRWCLGGRVVWVENGWRVGE